MPYSLGARLLASGTHGRAGHTATVAPQVTQPVSAGELLVSVPRACVISAEEDPQWGLSLRELLTARLCGALSRGECEAYTQSLPQAEPLLCSEALSKPGPVAWPRSAHRPRLAEARGSLRRDLALRDAACLLRRANRHG